MKKLRKLQNNIENQDGILNERLKAPQSRYISEEDSFRKLELLKK